MTKPIQPHGDDDAESFRLFGGWAFARQSEPVEGGEGKLFEIAAHGFDKVTIGVLATTRGNLKGLGPRRGEIDRWGGRFYNER